MNQKLKKHIEEELAALERGESRPWWAQSELLDNIDLSGYWRFEADSFTRWLERNAFRFGVKPPMLWRRLTAGRFVRQIKERLESFGIELPNIECLSEHVGPESVELLAKIERAIPEDVFPDLARKVFLGEVTRAQLRSMWAAYKPVLGGKTARGRGVLPPKINTTDPDQYNSLMEAMALDSLKAAGPVWSGHVKPKLYQVFFHVTPDGYKVAHGSYLFSAVAVIRPVSGDIEYHGFRYCEISILAKFQRDFSAADYCDYLWIMVPPQLFSESMKSKMLGALPAYAGLVLFRNGRVEVLKQAMTSTRCGGMRDKLISALFSRSLEGK